jgi:metallo-beta-lactamase family protein
MTIKITFLGAAQNVTGSRYLIEANNHRILVDCGMHQERPLKDRDWNPLPFSPKMLDAVLLTHAHLDHSGLIPKLVRDGCNCPIYSTPATAELAKIILLDSAELQQEDAEFKKGRHKKEGRNGPHPEMPLYTVQDVETCVTHCVTVPYESKIVLADGIEASFHDAGHILGSANVRIKISQPEGDRVILFSGDLGRSDSPMLQDPHLFNDADYVVVESTYGDRLHESREKSIKDFTTAINMANKMGGNIVMPVFAMERAQDILYYLNKFLLEDKIPHLAVFVDSPMAVSIIEVFKKYTDLFDDEMKSLLMQHESPFSFPNLHLVTSIQGSKEINHIRGTVIIMAGSGMCTGGRIKHHLVANISRPESTIIFVGYQASGTLGRTIVEGAKEVRILGEMYQIRARIVQLDGFSAHADRDEIIKWLSSFAKPPKKIFVTHGETNSALSFAKVIKDRLGYSAVAPAYMDQVNLE